MYGLRGTRLFSFIFYSTLLYVLSRLALCCMFCPVLHSVVMFCPVLHSVVMFCPVLQWSFGVTCWEIFSGGKTPYPGIDPRTLVQMLDAHQMLGKPANAACSDKL